jgi:hypothetical protein
MASLMLKQALEGDSYRLFLWSGRVYIPTEI